MEWLVSLFLSESKLRKSTNKTVSLSSILANNAQAFNHFYRIVIIKPHSSSEIFPLALLKHDVFISPAPCRACLGTGDFRLRESRG